MRLLHNNLGCVFLSARHRAHRTFPTTPRPESSGSGQPTLSTMLSHDGKNPFRSTGTVNSAKQILEATIK
jgi:hypothetical protein